MQQDVLDWDLYADALAVLKREQQLYALTPREKLLFRAFNFVVCSFVMLLIVLILYIWIVGDTDDVYLQIGGWVEIMLYVAIIPLFVLNWRFISKLRRQVLLRRQLGLEMPLKSIFQYAKNRSRLRRVGTIAIAVLGIVLIPVGVGMIVIFFIILAIFSEINTQFFSLGLIAFASIIVVAASLISLHFMWRGKQRQELVQEFLDKLTENQRQFGEGRQNKIKLDPNFLDSIARIERAQIIDERRQSLSAAAKERPRARYRLQMGDAAWAKAPEFGESERIRAEMKFIQLTRAPMPEGKSNAPKSRILEESIPDTDLKVVYEVDEDKKLVTIHSVARASDASRAVQSFGE